MVETETAACEKDERECDKRDRAKGIAVERMVVRSHPEVCDVPPMTMKRGWTDDCLTPVNIATVHGEI
jgi:hypothetical protein